MTLLQKVKTYLASHPSDITVILPFEGQQNSRVIDVIERLRPDAVFIDDLMRKLGITYVRELILQQSSYFRQYYCSPDMFRNALCEFDRQTKKMGEYYRTHLMNYYELRSVVEQVIRTEYPEVANYFDNINGKDILYIIDGSEEGSHSIETATRELKRYFSPKSITFITFYQENDETRNQRCCQNRHVGRR